MNKNRSIFVCTLFALALAPSDFVIASTEIIESPANADPRLEIISGKFANLSKLDGMPVRLTVSVSRKIAVNSYVQSVTEQFLADIGREVTESFFEREFHLSIRSNGAPSGPDVGTKYVLLSAAVSDERNGRVVLRSSLRLTCSASEGFGDRECPYDDRIVRELLLRLQ